MAESVAIYMRVSTKDQNCDNQHRELIDVCRRNGWWIAGEYRDAGISGAKGREDRLALDQMMQDAMRKKFDRVVVWSVDRLGRSLKHLVFLLEDLKSKKISVYAHKQGIDTGTPTGMMMWSFLSIFSEFEREMIRERVKAGIERARADGTKLGRPRISKASERKILELRDQGMGMVKIGRTLGVGTSQVSRVVNARLSQAGT